MTDVLLFLPPKNLKINNPIIFFCLFDVISQKVRNFATISRFTTPWRMAIEPANAKER